MSTDSLFGGGDETGGGGNDLIDADDRALLDSLLGDLFNHETVEFQGGGTLVVGNGPGGEKQGALTPGTGDLTGVFQNGDLELEIDVPAGLGLTFTGKDGQDEAAAENYLNNQITTMYFNANQDLEGIPPEEFTPSQQHQLSLTNAVDDLLGSLGGGKDISVRLIDFLGKTSPGALSTLESTDLRSAQALIVEDTVALPQASALVTKPEVIFDAGESVGKQVFAVNLANLRNASTVVLKNVEGAVLGASGSVRFENDKGVRVSSDNFAQDITGGTGNDTLVGGGNDTLTGGAGADVFGFTGLIKGHFTITDFNKATDTLGLKLDGVTTFAELQAAVTEVSYGENSITYALGEDLSVTLVGVKPADITADLIKFTF